MPTNRDSAPKKRKKKKLKLHFRLKLWWIFLFLVPLYVNWRFDDTIYTEEQLIPVTCAFQEIEIHLGYRPSGTVCYIIDTQQRAYRLDMENLRPFKSAVKPGDILKMKIEPRKSSSAPYDKRIAYLEANGTVFYTIEEYLLFKQKMVRQGTIMTAVIYCFLGISLIFIFFLQNPQLCDRIEYRYKKRKKRNQQKRYEKRKQKNKKLNNRMIE